jgi:hypothetical protein
VVGLICPLCSGLTAGATSRFCIPVYVRVLRRVLCPSRCDSPLCRAPVPRPYCRHASAARPSPHAPPPVTPHLSSAHLRPAVNPFPEFAKECAAALSRVRGPRLPLLYVVASPPALRRASVCPFHVRVLRRVLCPSAPSSLAGGATVRPPPLRVPGPRPRFRALSHPAPPFTLLVSRPLLSPRPPRPPARSKPTPRVRQRAAVS